VGELALTTPLPPARRRHSSMAVTILALFSASCFVSIVVVILVARRLANSYRLRDYTFPYTEPQYPPRVPDQLDVPEWVSRPKTGPRRYYLIDKNL
jgi:hypothetical protein